MIELKPCPFHGGKAYLNCIGGKRPDFWYIETDCCDQGFGSYLKTYVIKNWNTRVTPPPAKEVCPKDCMYLVGRFCKLGANHCSRVAEDFYCKKEVGE